MILDYTNKKKVTYPQKRHFCYFSLLAIETRIVNTVGWNIPNDNNARDMHLEETECIGIQYTPVFSEQGI